MQNVHILLRQENFSHPDEIKATTISSRWNKGNKDSIGQVGQADPHRRTQTFFLGTDCHEDNIFWLELRPVLINRSSHLLPSFCNHSQPFLPYRIPKAPYIVSHFFLTCKADSTTFLLRKSKVLLLQISPAKQGKFK